MSDAQQNYTQVQDGVQYHPELLGNAQMEAGEPVQRWEDYALELVPIKIDGDDTGKRAIMRNGEFLEVCSDRYKLLPNEEVVDVANEVADELGAVPFHEFDGDWYIQLDDHVIQDEEGRRVHALYAWDDPVDIDGSGDTVQLGFAVHNSIDTSLGFNVGLFTFRHACQNMVWMGVNGQGMSFDQRDVIDHTSHKHTAGLEIENLRAWVENTVEYGPTVIDAYQAWTDETLSVRDAMDLFKRARRGQLSKGKDVPDWLREAIEEVEEIEEALANNETLNGERFPNGLTEDRVASTLEAKMPKAETTWETYNSLTENIWHNSDTDDRSKIRKMKVTHRALQPGDVTDDDVQFR